jgi:hypothetical protein
LSDADDSKLPIREISLDDALSDVLREIAALDGDIAGQVKLAVDDTSNFSRFISALGLSEDQEWRP